MKDTYVNVKYGRQVGKINFSMSKADKGLTNPPRGSVWWEFLHINNEKTGTPMARKMDKVGEQLMNARET